MRRRSEEGVALLEVLIAIALVAMFLAGVLVYQSRAAADQRQRLDNLLLTEFAYGKLEEWSIGGAAATDFTGSSDSGWHWEIEEVDAPVVEPSSLDSLVVFRQIEVVAWHDNRPDFRVSVSAVVARRRQ
jgi:hypothetical protein